MVKRFLKGSYLPTGLGMLGMPFRETKLFKEVSQREETPPPKVKKKKKTEQRHNECRRNHRVWAGVPERKRIPNRGGEGSGEKPRGRCVMKLVVPVWELPFESWVSQERWIRVLL